MTRTLADPENLASASDDSDRQLIKMYHLLAPPKLASPVKPPPVSKGAQPVMQKETAALIDADHAAFMHAAGQVAAAAQLIERETAAA